MSTPFQRWSLAFSLCFALGCSDSSEKQLEAQLFLDRYSVSFQKLSYAASLAEWESDTRIIEGDDTNARRTREAKETLAAFTGSLENIEVCRDLLSHRDKLPPVQVRQLEAILYLAADKPQTVAELVRQRIAVETDQSEKLYGFSFKIADSEVSTNQIDEILRLENRLPLRRQAWVASKDVGSVLRPGLEKLQRLRNETVRALGYDDFFSYQVSEYKMSTSEMLDLMRQILREIRPLYRELHTFVRYSLAEKYDAPVPEMIPAHWLPNRWGQDWQALTSVEGLDLEAALREKNPEWLVEQAERFYVSLGFEPLPVGFSERSSLYPLPPDAQYKKNNHASAWHLDLEEDVRSLMSVESNASWYETVHHELGHVYYFLSYSNPEVPLMLRSGANRAFHEAIGSLMGLAATQRRFVEELGLLPDTNSADPIQTLLKEALNYVVFIPWSAGVMTEFEHSLYALELPSEEWNTHWWELKKQHQGIAAPDIRSDPLCDPATKTHINDDAAQYYDYALSFLLLFQFHDYIAREILQQDPRDTNWLGRKDVGRYLEKIMSVGANVDWPDFLKEVTGQELSARSMLEYFAPLMEWLQQQNQGREHTLPG